MSLSREEIAKAYDYACKRRCGRRSSMYLMVVLRELDYPGALREKEIKAFLKQKLDAMKPEALGL